MTANQTGSDKGLLMLCMEAGSNIQRVVVAVSNSQHGVLGLGQRSPTDTGASGRHTSSRMLQLMLELDNKIQASCQGSSQGPPASHYAPTSCNTGGTRPIHSQSQVCTPSRNSPVLRNHAGSNQHQHDGYWLCFLSLPSLVPQKVKDQVWAGALGSLLPGRQKEVLQVQVGGGDGNPALQTVPQHRVPPFSGSEDKGMELLCSDSGTPKAGAHNKPGASYGDSAVTGRVECRMAVL